MRHHLRRRTSQRQVQTRVVYQALDDASDITVADDFGTREAAQASVASDEVQAAMGVHDIDIFEQWLDNVDGGALSAEPSDAMVGGR